MMLSIGAEYELNKNYKEPFIHSRHINSVDRKTDIYSDRNCDYYRVPAFSMQYHFYPFIFFIRQGIQLKEGCPSRS